VVISNITLTFPLKSSYLIDNAGVNATTLNVTLPTISSSNIGAETIFIKNTGLSINILTPNNYILGTNLTIDTSGVITIPANVQYYRIIATKSTEGYYVWTCINILGDITGTLNLIQKTSTNSAILQFKTDDGFARANFYSSVIDNVFRFDIQSAYNSNGFEWRNGSTGVVLMKLDLNGNLTTNSIVSTPVSSTATTNPGTLTYQSASSALTAVSAVSILVSRSYVNGITTINYSSGLWSNRSQMSFNTLSSFIIPFPPLLSPYPSTNFLQSVDCYDQNGTTVRGYVAFAPNYNAGNNSTNNQSLIFTITGTPSASTYYIPNFRIVYC